MPRRTLNPAEQAAIGLAVIEDLSPAGTAARRYTTAQRILDAIAEIDGRPFDPVTGEFIEGRPARSIGKLQAVDRAAELLLPEGQLAADFASSFDV
jgi:hypothetical protein